MRAIRHPAVFFTGIYSGLKMREKIVQYKYSLKELHLLLDILETLLGLSLRNFFS